MELNLKKSGRKTITRSFSLSAKTAEFISFYADRNDCTASSFIDELVGQFKRVKFPNYDDNKFNNEF